MAITVDPLTYIINVPRDDLSLVQLVPSEIRTMDLEWFRLQLHDLMDDVYGMPMLKMFTHNTEVVLGGVTYARIIEILDPYTITFEDGQYAVNLTGANSNVADKTNVNQVSVRPQNSAGLISSADIEYASFNGGITYDEVGGYAGTGKISNGANIGTPRAPSNNAYDARFIAFTRGFKTGYIIGDMNLPEYELDGTTPFEVEGFTFIGSGKSSTTIDIPDITDARTCKYYDAHITGTLDGFNTLVDCYVDNLNYIKGFLETCVLAPGEIVLGGNDTAHFLDCYSGVPGTGTPTINMGGSGQALAMRNYNGGIRLTNKTGPESVSIDLNSGQVRLDLDTLTNGVIVVRGIGKVVDDDTDEQLETGWYGGLYLLNEAMNQANISSAVWDEPIADHLISGTTGHSIGISQFDGKVTVSASGMTGTIFPIGTAEVPVNNMDDAILIAEENGIDEIHFATPFTINGGTYSAYTFTGRGRKTPVITISNALMTGCQFKDLYITGDFTDGSIIGANFCSFEDVTGIALTAYECVFHGYLELENGQDTNLYSCVDGIPGVGIPDIRVNTCDTLGIWDWNGGIRLSNIITPNTEITCMITAGRLWVDSTCVEGDIIVKGMADLRGTTGGTTIDKDGLVTKDTFSEAVWDEPIGNHLISGTTGKSVGVSQYDGKVSLDVTNGEAGTAFPIGTEEHPVNNLPDAITIANDIGTNVIILLSDLTVTSGQNISGFQLKSTISARVTIEPGAFTIYTLFERVSVQGELNGYTLFNNSSIHPNGITEFHGLMDRTVMNGSIGISSNNTDNAIFLDLFSGDVGGPGEIDCGGDGAKISMRGLTGACLFTNKTGSTQKMFIDLYSGRVGFDSTITAGQITVRGVGTIYQNDSTGATFNTDGLMSKSTIAEAVLDADITEHQTEDTVGYMFMKIAYGNKIFLDTSTSNTGSDYPTGLPEHAVNNVDDAIALMAKYDCTELHIHSDITINATHDLSHQYITGHTEDQVVTCDNPLVDNTTFRNVFVTGTVVGRATYNECKLSNLSGVAGHIEGCQIDGDIHFSNVTSGETIMHNCTSVTVLGPTLHVYDETVICSQMSGAFTGADITTGTFGFGGDFCRVTLDASCTGGIAAIGTKGTIVDNSAGTFVALSNSLTPETIADATWEYERTP